MPEVVKLLGEEISIDTANTVGNGTLIRVMNMSGANGTFVITNEANTVTGSASIPDGQDLVIRKNRTDTVEGTGLLAVSVAVAG